MPAQEQNFLDAILQFCDIDKEHIEFVRKSLFKYKDNPVVITACRIINENAVQARRLQEIFSEAYESFWKTHNPKKYPLIIPSPNSPTELRVYPNIFISNFSSLDEVSSTYCTEALKDFLVEYEADIADERKKQRWEPLDRAEKRLLEYIDMPTARALTRFVFPEGVHKDSIIRDFAEAIDSCRKPLELKFAEKPEDFHTMYNTGPTSCMAYNAGDRDRWKFLNDLSLAPGSWYYYCPFTTGVWSEKNGKVVARTVLFKNDKMKNWQYIRVYATNEEIKKKFKDSLEERGITACQRADIADGFSFTVPGVKKGADWAAPWPYLDSPMSASHTTGKNWTIKFDKDTKEFTFYHTNNKFDTVNSRTGHIIASDYSTINCTSCEKVIKTRGNTITRTDHDSYVFCSDQCAANEDFIKVIEGNGGYVYKQNDDALVDIVEHSFIKISTPRAAIDLGYFPIMEEAGIFPEENSQRVTAGGSNIRDTEGKYYRIFNTGHENYDTLAGSKIPFKVNTPVKNIQWSELVIEL